MKEKISIRGAPDFMEFFNSLNKQSDRYKEINEALDLLKKDYAKGDKIPRDRWPRKYIKEHKIHTLFRFKLRVEACVYSIRYKTGKSMYYFGSI